MNVVIYARYSCSNQREESIEGQLKVCYKYANDNNYTVIGEYIDRAISGTTDKRPEFQRMIEDSKKREFEGVLVYQLDRFARNRNDSAINKTKLKKNGVKVISACENINDDASGILMESMLEGMAEYYSKELSQKVIRGMNINASKCLSNGGTTPLGFYIGPDKKYHIDENTAPIVIKIFEMYTNGHTIKEIIDFLNKRNYKTSRGNAFNNSSLYKMLTNKKYIGYYVYNGQEIENGVPQIIDKDIFDKCQKIIEKNRIAPARAKAKEEYLLSTKLYCGICNTAMIGVSGKGENGNKYCYYRCKNRQTKSCNQKTIQKNYLEDIVVKETKKILTDKNIEKIAKEIVKQSQKEKAYDLVSALNKQIIKIQKEIENLLKAIENGNISDLIVERIAEKKKEKEELEKQVKIEKLKKPIITIENVTAFLTHFKNGNIEEIKYKKELINVFVNKIIVYENKITILYNIQDSYSDILFNPVMVNQRRLERPTHGLEGRCSIQLSYWSISNILNHNIIL